MQEQMTINRPRLRLYWLLLVLVLLIGGGVFFATSSHPNIWPLRNVLLYQVNAWREAQFGTPAPTGTGALRGCVVSNTGEPLPGATVLVSEHDGVTHSAAADATGCYQIAGIPAGRYVPVAGAAGHPDTAVRSWGQPLSIDADATRMLDMTLPPNSLPAVAPGTNLRISEPITLTWALPTPGEAVRRELHFNSGGKPNQLTYLYSPVTGSDLLPTLLAVYPGPADTWEGVSIPLAAAGYTVIAVGPAYSLELDNDIDELQRLVNFARAGKLPRADGQRMAVLGGSYSSLHVMAMLRRDVGFRGAVLLGPPTDLFDLRRRFEEGSFFPPFGLDQVLIALGTPDTQPERYWRFSARYHVRRDMPPLLLMHSRNDEVVPFQQSELLAEELDAVGVEYEAHFFDGMSHYLLADRPSEDLDRLYNITLDFLERTLIEVP